MGNLMTMPMRLALDAAISAARAGEVPVGAVVTDAKGNVISLAANQTEATQNPLMHAEFLALSAARTARAGKYLTDCTLTVTLEPCAFCAGAIAALRVGTLMFGAYDPKTGAVEHGPRLFSHATTHHKPEIIGGVWEQDCARLLQDFFAQLRDA